MSAPSFPEYTMPWANERFLGVGNLLGNFDYVLAHPEGIPAADLGLLTARRDKLREYHAFLGEHIMHFKEPGRRPCYCCKEMYTGVRDYLHGGAGPSAQESVPDLDKQTITEILERCDAPPLLQFNHPRAHVITLIANGNAELDRANPADHDLLLEYYLAQILLRVHRINSAKLAAQAAARAAGKARASPAAAAGPAEAGKAAGAADEMPPPRTPRMQCHYRGSGRRLSRGRGGSISEPGDARGSSADSRGSRGSSGGSGVNWRGGTRAIPAAGVRGLAEPLNLSPGAGKALRGPAPRAGAGIASKTYGDCMSAVVESIHVEAVKDQAGIDQLLASACGSFDNYFSKTDNIVRDVHSRVKDVKSAWEQFVEADLAFGVQEAKFQSAKEAGDDALADGLAGELDRLSQRRAHAARELRAAKVQARDLIQTALCYDLPEVLDSARSVFKDLEEDAGPARRRRIEPGDSGCSSAGSGGSRGSSKRRYESGDGGCGN